MPEQELEQQVEQEALQRQDAAVEPVNKYLDDNYSTALRELQHEQSRQEFEFQRATAMQAQQDAELLRLAAAAEERRQQRILDIKQRADAILQEQRRAAQSNTQKHEQDARNRRLRAMAAKANALVAPPAAHQQFLHQPVGGKGE
jgi:hypothetical protein